MTFDELEATKPEPVVSREWPGPVQMAFSAAVSADAAGSVYTRDYWLHCIATDAKQRQEVQGQ